MTRFVINLIKLYVSIYVDYIWLKAVKDSTEISWSVV